jgi:hypothetical protein
MAPILSYLQCSMCTNIARQGLQTVEENYG